MSERSFRRPASLDQAEAEAIVGDEDPAAESEIAHTTAWALLGVPNADFDEAAVAKLRESVRTEGVDIIAAAWSKSPEFTLPGALWRIYLLWQWSQLNTEVLTDRYQEGLDALGGKGVDVHDQPPLEEVIRGVEGVLAGYANEDDLATVLESSAQAMRIMAMGVRFGPEWITEEDHVLAHTVTRRPQALLDTARELDESAQQAAAGTLD